MSSDADKFWGELARQLRLSPKVKVPSLAEAQAELNAADEVPLTDADIDAIVEASNAYLINGCAPSEDPADSVVAGGTDEMIPILNRNPGNKDAARDKVDEARRAVFGSAGTAGPHTKFDWKVEQQRQELASNAAEELLENLRIVAPPIDPVAIAQQEAPLLHIRGDDFANLFDGQLEYHKQHGRFLLLFNTKYNALVGPGEHHPRTRFSVAHELGHYYLEAHRQYLLEGGRPRPSHAEFTSAETIEREADAFAAGLLMPARLMAPMVNLEPLTLDRISELASTFRTSFVSTAIRSVQLSDYPCALVGIRGGEIAWRFHSTSLTDAGYYPRAKGKRVPPSAMEQWHAMAAGNTSAAESESSIEEWFELYERTELGNIPVTEHFMPVSVMDLLLVLLTAAEQDLFSDEDE